ncbi:hypothetical protein [Streptosporangium sp. NPDC023615]|uniref:hypothetical protein n=1 Tax=Streptosporangium sp. NPDC023615 TaxID=3154794 RepID=UPI003424EF43
MPAYGDYPIVEERALRPPRRRWGLFPHRTLDELPETSVGTVLVFALNGGYKAYTEGHHLRGTEDAVVEARSVSVVYMRNRQITLAMELPSQDMGYQFLLKVAFRCRVIDAEAVVSAGVENAAELLANHLRDDAQLMQLGTTRPVEEVHLLSVDVVNRVRAYLEFYPPRIDGLEVTLVSVDLLPPSDILAHGQRLKQLKWDRESKELRWAIENRDVARIEEIFKRGVEAGTAFGVSREQLLMTDAIAINRDTQENRMRTLSELINRMPDGALDFLPLDTHRLIKSVMTSVTGDDPFVEVPTTPEPPVLGSGRPPQNGNDGPRRVRLEDLDD